MKFLKLLLLAILISTATSSTIRAACDNSRTVFDGNVGVLFELLPSSAPENDIIQFVEKTLLNSLNYGLGSDSVTGNRHTLATTLPYPTTSSYTVKPYGSVTTLSDVTSQVDAFNSNIRSVSSSSSILDGFNYILSNLPSGQKPSALIVVGNSQWLIQNGGVVNYLKQSFKIFTIAIGNNPGDFTGLSSGQGYSFTVSDGNEQYVADLISLKIKGMNQGNYCPPSGPTVFNGNIAVTFELNAHSPFVTLATSFLMKNLYNSSYYKFDDGTTQALNVPYPDTDSYHDTILKYGDAKSMGDLATNVDQLWDFSGLNDFARISEGLKFINTHRPPTKQKAVVIVVGTQDTFATADTTRKQMTKLESQGYKFISVAVGSKHGDLSPLASDPSWYFVLDWTNGQALADQIALILSRL